MDEFTKDLAIKANKDRIIELLKSTERPGMDKLIDYMDKQGFFTAPCSTSGNKHLACEGGLAEHSLNVYKMVKMLGQSIADGELPIMSDEPFEINSQIIVSLLHDLGKMGHHNKPNYIPNILKSGKISDSKPFETNKDLAYVEHETVSLTIASRFIELTEEEYFAIRYHNGLYAPSGRDLNGKERPLQMLLHFADLWCSRVVEVENE